MSKALSKYTREELERKLLHMTAFIAFKLATEYIERTEPTAKVIRTKEAEEENDQRIADHIVCIFPAWDIVEETHPGYKEAMREWVEKNHKAILVRPCICDGCKDLVKDAKA